MLVLSRKRDESIMIGDGITVTVVDIRGDKVRLGITAPLDVSVHRQEVFEAIQRERKPAHGTAEMSDVPPPAPPLKARSRAGRRRPSARR